MARLLVTGGAGYVGAHCCLALAEAGHDLAVVDNFSNGHRAFARFGATFEADVRDAAALDAAFAAHKPEAVLHFAALIEVGESVKDPAAFYDVNVTGALNVLAAMRRHGVPRFVFSSTCATYGAPLRLPLDETHPQWPLSPYGWTKLSLERALIDYAGAYGLRSMILRYFNAAGAAPEAGLGERHDPETHAIPLALFTLLGRRERFMLFGEDYDTRDGSCVRDYVHVLDLADAHRRAVEALLDGADGAALNLGSGTGTTVKELIAAIETQTGRAVPLVRAPRRPGDSPALVAAADEALRVLGWRPTRDVGQIIDSAWRWHSEVEPRLFGS